DGTVAPNVGDQRSNYDGYVQGPQKRLWTYQCCRGHGCVQGPIPPENVPGSGWPSYMVDTSAAKNRAMQWLAFRERVSGELYYETAMALPRAWTDQYEFGGNGDGTLFYPGTPARIGGQTDVPVASIRLKLIRSGMQDYELLKMVSDAGDPDFARRIVDEVVPASHRVPDDGAVFESARLKLLRRLVELRPDAWEAPGAGNPPGTETPLPYVGGGGCSAAGTASLIPLALILLAGLLGKRGVLVPVRIKPPSGGGRGARRGKAAPGGR
ncbi:MAG TPA: DUF4091 domain-containing protein, partial [Myxococcaceae bacterium]|nr:DUF4091 domain-containing protein [Myxococcaceae bacterium]